MQFTKTTFALLAASMAAAAPAENVAAANNAAAAPANVNAIGETFFTADGYYHIDCTGNNYWSYEIAAVPKTACLSEMQEIGSVWIHNYGDCPDDKVKVEQFGTPHCNGAPMSTQYTSRGQCMGMANDGWGAYSIRISCEGVN